MSCKIIQSKELHDKIITDYQTGLSSKQVANKHNCSASFVLNILQRNNITKRTTYDYIRKYDVKEDFFDCIDTEPQAYFLGLLYADGNNYIGGNSYEVSIDLQESDLHILELFRNLLCPDMPIKPLVNKRTNNKHFLFKINNKKISSQLSKLGCVPNKSLVLTFPEFIPDHLLNHFVRGYFDGDGCICKDKPTKTGYVNYKLSIISSNQFCETLRCLIEQMLDIRISSRLSSPKTNQITTTLSIGGNLQVRTFLDWLYADSSVFLQRKFDKYKEMPMRNFASIY